MAPQPRHSSGRFLPKPTVPPDLQPGPRLPNQSGTANPPAPGSATPGAPTGLPANPGSRGGGQAEPGHRLRPAAIAPKEDAAA